MFLAIKLPWMTLILDEPTLRMVKFPFTFSTLTAPSTDLMLPFPLTCTSMREAP